MNTQPTVFIIDTCEQTHSSIKQLMKQANLKVVSYHSAEDFLKNYQPEQPGCLLLDLCVSSFELHEQLKAQNIHLPVIVLAAYGDVPTIRRAKKAGVFDFFPKPFSPQELFECVQQAIKLDAHLRRESAQRRKLLACLDKLTKQEREVMNRLVMGKSNKAIAFELNIRYKTVQNYHTKIKKKTQTRNVVELVHIAYFCGLLSPCSELIFSYPSLGESVSREP
jgi:two-component system, LuxR family, response regulator FixJ